MRQRPQMNQAGNGADKRLPRDYFVMKASGPNSKQELRIQEEIWDQILEIENIDPTEIEVDVRKDTVTLMGTTESLRMKNKIEHIVRNLRGVKKVLNQIHVLERFPTVDQ